ncbi:RNA polymerase sigma factor [Spirosoma sp. KUDC1026]|uniref:RNA polymerase sigma factor n=1 Tax=Spirosoma sp. KUDC1026 TaxID=2745947 RepID=UPI00159BA8D0|nr:sigma-70 family RNA polymerase sigma factor [Spirosoma sp. KUDC1026]QKZ12530.1 sigma-70 family RNA polymerase sigma factor [Spirosoma sp. KUDC1026]
MKKHSPADEQLVHAFLTTPSPQSFDTLYRRYLEKVYRTCLSFTNDTQTAQDYAQDIFLKVFRKLDTFEHQSSFSTWLYAIAHNHCLGQHRRHSRLPTEPLAPAHVQTIVGNYSFMEDADEDRLRLLELQLAQLSPMDRDLLRLKYEQGVSIADLSQRYQLSESAVKMRLKRSRDRLRDLCIRAGDE